MGSPSPRTEEELYDLLRRAILDMLANQLQRVEHKARTRDVAGHLQIPSSLEELQLQGEFSHADKERMGPLVHQIYHELFLERIIAPGIARFSYTNHKMEWPFFRITAHGKRVLQNREYSPYDPNGYLHRLKEEISGIDETIVRYVEESLRCLRMDCLLAAAVTIGCASEKAMLLLIEHFGAAIKNSTKKAEYEKETGNWMIGTKYNAFRKRIDSIAQNLPKELRAPLEQQLHGTFDLIRRVRNDAGHPSGEPVTRDVILASHIGFPGYCKYVYSLIGYFGTNSVTL